MPETANSGSWKHEVPYKLADEDRDFDIKYTASCMCGEVQYAANADPVSAKYCHCTDCQRLHGAPFQWAALFHKDALRFVKGVDSLMFYDSSNNQEEHHLPCKVSCSKCHSPMADEGRKMWMAFPTLFNFDDGKTPEAFRGSCHIFYQHRRVNVNDGTPKWAGLNNKSEQMQEAQ